MLKVADPKTGSLRSPSPWAIIDDRAAVVLRTRDCPVKRQFIETTSNTARERAG